MNLKKKDPVNPEMTFDKSDLLNRKGIVENFDLLLRDASQPFVIALNSPWGSGKTQFIHMWMNLLKEENKKSIYLNLWEEDFLKNPFFSLTNCLFNKFQEASIGESEKLKEWRKLGVELSRALTNSVLNVNIENLMKEEFEKEQRQKKQEFKDNLSNFSKKVKEDTNFPLIIFVDELDRCRPDYAIEFLEVAKHFFNVENVIFVLGIDAEQLQHSIKCLYGEGMNAKEYLRKFVDISYEFPEPELERYLDFLFSVFNCGKKEVAQIMAVKSIIKKFNPKLRAVDNLFTRLNLIEGGINSSYVEASFLLCLKIFREDLYNKLINLNIDEILNYKNYFDAHETGLGQLTFWKLANDWLLTNSSSEINYLQNLRRLFSSLGGEGSFIEQFLVLYLSSMQGAMDMKFCFNPLSKIFFEDKVISQQKNIDIVKNIFRNRNSYLKEYKVLIQKIEFLEGLDFGKEDREDKPEEKQNAE